MKPRAALRKKKEMLKKLCSYPGCHKVVNDGVKYCEKHQAKDKERRREQNREYKRNRMQDADEARRQRLYTSEAWRRFRIAQRSKQFGIDVYEYYTTGRIINAEEYHHIQDVKEAWTKRFDSENVIGLSRENHELIHTEYAKGYVEKKRMQRILREMLLRFEREFG
jgi:hypothetical protein